MVCRHRDITQAQQGRSSEARPATAFSPMRLTDRMQQFFWTQKGPSKGAKGRIFSASLDSPKDPANRPDVELVAGNLPEPIDLEFDEESSVLYWTDRGELPLGNTLNKKTIGGQTPAAEQRMGRQILAQGFGEAIGK